MVMLGDTTSSLKEVMSVITEFGTYSGLIINCTKSPLMPVDVAPDSPSLVTANILICSAFRYLGIQVTLSPLDYSFNLMPLLARFRGRIKVLKRLPY